MTTARIEALVRRFAHSRARTEELAAPLSPEDQILQSMPSASPTKWHRAHTTWFYETFALAPQGVAPLHAAWGELFNSYYESAGPRHARPKRGLLSRPSADEIAAYRAAVDARVVEMLLGARAKTLDEVEHVIHVGIAHEEQHQELLLTDILHALSESPLRPAYRSTPIAPSDAPIADEPLAFISFDGEVRMIGASESEPFSFDNERPRHKRWLEPFALADRLVTVREVKAFITDRGYQTPSLWLSEGWDFVQSHGLVAPMYARIDGDSRDSYSVFGLDGVREARDDEPATHVSFYEADAIARWLSARLPTETEWEVAASNVDVQGTFVESRAFRALACPPRDSRVRQLFGDAWQWTRSSYEPYPGYAPYAGTLGEYNGKFMVSQVVMRGGSYFTPRDHVRASYRNFWPPDTRFQVTGIRLAKDL